MTTLAAKLRPRSGETMLGHDRSGIRRSTTEMESWQVHRLLIRLVRKEGREVITTERTLEERYEAVHAAILDGPNAQLQEWLDSGLVWHLEGFVGRQAMAALQDGAVVLPPERHRDYYGVTVPSYSDIVDEPGSPGSVANAEAYDPERSHSPSTSSA